MANNGVPNQADVASLNIAADGSFKRVVSTFRDVIEKGGKFEPEEGSSVSNIRATLILTNVFRPLSSIRVLWLS